MNDFIKTMNTLVEVLQSLDVVLNQEQTLLCAGRVNGIALQTITEQKSSLLTTVDYLDAQRRQHDKRLKQNAPYSRLPEIAQQWKKVVEISEKLSRMNQHNGLLINKQLDYNTQALAVLSANNTQNFYGPNGQTKPLGQSVRKISI